jgi:DNA polymerase IV (archaeal DinB-like DNA polymerase)
VSTCLYEVRKSGTHSATPISKAYKLCPDAAFVPTNMKLHEGASAKVMEILKRFCLKVRACECG